MPRIENSQVKRLDSTGTPFNQLLDLQLCPVLTKKRTVYAKIRLKVKPFRTNILIVNLVCFVASDEVVLLVRNVMSALYDCLVGYSDSAITESVRFWNYEAALREALSVSILTKALTRKRKDIHLLAFNIIPIERKNAGISAK
jgi:hypothetical protein